MAHPCRHHHCYNVLYLERRRMMRCLMDETDESRFQSDSRVRHDMLMTTYFRNGMCRGTNDWVLKVRKYIHISKPRMVSSARSYLSRTESMEGKLLLLLRTKIHLSFCERHGMSLCAQYTLRLIHRKRKKDSACHIYHNTTVLRFSFPCSFLFFGYLFCIIFRPTILITTTSSSTSSTSSLVFRFHTILLVERPTFKVGIHHPFSTIYPIQTLVVVVKFF